jgi:hypothetical protein
MEGKAEHRVEVEQGMLVTDTVEMIPWQSRRRGRSI